MGADILLRIEPVGNDCLVVRLRVGIGAEVWALGPFLVVNARERAIAFESDRRSIQSRVCSEQYINAETFGLGSQVTDRVCECHPDSKMSFVVMTGQDGS